MGSGIATALALAGIEVVLKEVNQQFLDVSRDCVFWGRGGGVRVGYGWVVSGAWIELELVKGRCC